VSVYEEKESYAASRANGLGGSDVAAILGFSPWKTPFEVWEAKVAPEKIPALDSEMLWWGLALEPIVRDRYAQRLGVDVIAPEKLSAYFKNTRPWNAINLVIGEEPWMIAAPDGWIPSMNRGYEGKCSARKSGEWGAEGSEEVPAHYFVADSWYMKICEAFGWNFGVLFSGNTLQEYRIERDPVFERNMTEVARAFWHDYVVKKTEPPIDQTVSCGAYFARKFSLSTGEVITKPSQEILDFTAEMRAASEQKATWEAREREANNHLRALIGDAQKAITPMGSVGWVRPEKKLVTDWEAVGKEVGPLHPEIVKAHTEEEQRAAFLRAWWSRK
jgi:putative phage-type endonuclease